MRRIYFGIGLIAGAAMMGGAVIGGNAVIQAASPSPFEQALVSNQQQPATPWLGLSLDVQDGKVIVRDVVPDGPAAKAGIKRYDQITSVNGKNITSVDDARNALSGKKAGDVVPVVYSRSGVSATVQVTLADLPQRGRPNGPAPQQRPQIQLPKWLEDLRNIPANERFDRQRGGSFSYRNNDGKTVTIQTIPGKFTQADSSGGFTITRNDGGNGSFKTDGSTSFRGIKGLADLKAGDQVVVTVVQTEGTANSNLAVSVAKGGVGIGAPGGFRGPGGGPKGPIPPGRPGGPNNLRPGPGGQQPGGPQPGQPNPQR